MFAAVGRFCHRYRKTVLVGWLVFVVVGVASAGLVFSRMGDTDGTAHLESVQGWELLGEHRSDEHGGEVRAVISGKPVDDPALRSAVTGTLDELRDRPDVAEVTSWYDAPVPALRATDGEASAVLVRLERAGEDDELAAALAIRDRLHALGDSAGVDVYVGGGLLLEHEIDETVERDLLRAEMISLPLILVALLFIFGGFLAALLPLAAALVGAAGALLVLLGYSYLGGVSQESINVVSFLSLALAIDYGLLIVSRFREERRRGLSSADATARASATAGRAVAFSGVTVIVALSALYAFNEAEYSSMASAGIGVALVCMLAALTLVPALLGLVGHRLRGSRRPSTDDGVFARVTRWSQRRPLLVVTGVTVVLLGAAAPALGMTLISSDASSLPPSFESRQAADQMARFPGAQDVDVLVVAEASPSAPEVTGYLERVRERADVQAVEVVPGYDDAISVLRVTPASTGEHAAAEMVTALRADRPDVPTYVTGDDAWLLDFTGNVGDKLPLALAQLVLGMFVLLFLMTGSVLVPLKAIVMNVLSLGASFGAIVLIFQEGWGADLLGTEAMGGIEAWIPMLIFVFAFGLSMDYEVFLLSRIKEIYDEGVPNDEAVVLGVQRTGRIITSAALLVVIVFASFGSGQFVGIKEMGVALTIAILVDATIVRLFLVPATMTLLGDWNWWAPKPLRRLHDRFGVSESGRRPVVDIAPDSVAEPAAVPSAAP